ncbi:hypothetical protein [Erwinia aphidicola]|uniref:hypothetical protein n=1 Tax=Erwinia aphidicola TaxID=68334 RepID=UPI00209EDD48|nr:hypothetical protein [Erwinia aphidicola]MCP2232843.1 hypothetical protein [Erwinia aphidicola]
MKSYLHAPEVTDDVIQKAFEGTSFGRTDHREFLGYSLLNIACGWYCGHTITTIMIEMGLITPKNKTLTKLGRLFLSDCYDDPLRATTPPASSVPDRNQLRELVDMVWNEATESETVPSTTDADRIIDKVFQGIAREPISSRYQSAAPAPGGDGGHQS